MKLTQKKCKIRLHTTKSANARSGDTEGKSDLLASVVWIRRDATHILSASCLDLELRRPIPVRTNCPTVAEKPERKALKGCCPRISHYSVPNGAARLT